MKAVLSGFSGEKKLYYILDAKSNDQDGAVVLPDGKVITVSFFEFATSARKLKRLTKTPFHRFLWSEPDGEMKKIWVDTFIKKDRQIPKKFMGDVVVKTSLGIDQSKQKKTETKVKSFLQESSKVKEITANFSTLNSNNVKTGENYGN